MNPPLFDELCSKVSTIIKRRNTNYRRAITVGQPEYALFTRTNSSTLMLFICFKIGERVALALRFLATGESMLSLSLGFRIGHSTCCVIIRETCRAFYEVLAPDYLSAPTTDGWTSIAEDFDRFWDFPNCIGAIDGKHIRIQAPANSGSDFYNYKGYFSTDLGALGREGDRGIFASSQLYHRLENEQLGIPPPRQLPCSDKTLPYVIVGDEGFPLRQYLMRPYPGVRYGTLSQTKKIYNYRCVFDRNSYLFDGQISNVTANICCFFVDCQGQGE